ncbi:ABC-type dipeptide/oligopeptide/nickel transport system, permease component [Prosthecobacter debontii]|uniref:ABC-type dipeptide/oligopeptide/nickel transport system, permease component n=1 Tax=Prosthecobacter debontii TaxID=48467 RepID=A0A1T4WS83_9BACT|nr:ABC transporter permease [Prosthecobacter debontii]SKA80186.1 ABC-type dipeptide/oligopeptide/nickel transport system, permease component [Prosthecobacter debontii]
MRDYFIRRFLLIFPTLIGATLVVFFITRITPGGPMERVMQQALMNEKGGGKNAGSSLSEEQMEELAAYYGFDKPFLQAYGIWLGVLPREESLQFVKFEKETKEMSVTLKVLLPKEEWTPNNAYKLTQATVTRDGTLKAEDAKALEGWETRAEPAKERVVIYRPQRKGVIHGYFHVSSSYNQPVLEMMTSKMPVSIFYGLLTFIMTYVVCIPLGVLKAIKHRTVIDNVTSMLIFIGYSIPGFLLGSLMVVYLAARLGWFPTEGFTGENFDSLSFGGKVWDILHHAVLPLICYMIGSFAFMTMLMKNNLMDNLAADYVRTAIAKGGSFRRAVIGHALRNSLIPIATTLGSITTIFVGGSMLIERIFQIDGFGLLMIQSITDRDYPLVLGILTVDVFLIMLGNILSDYFVALTDPRVRFE